MRKSLILAVVWFATVFAAGLWGHAQVPVPPPTPRLPGTLDQKVISGPDLGFRVDSYKGRTPLGRFVVRIDGQWIEIEEAATIRRLTAR